MGNGKVEDWKFFFKLSRSVPLSLRNLAFLREHFSVLKRTTYGDIDGRRFHSLSDMMLKSGLSTYLKLWMITQGLLAKNQGQLPPALARERAQLEGVLRSLKQEDVDWKAIEGNKSLTVALVNSMRWWNDRHKQDIRGPFPEIYEPNFITNGLGFMSRLNLQMGPSLKGTYALQWKKGKWESPIALEIWKKHGDPDSETTPLGSVSLAFPQVGGRRVRNKRGKYGTENEPSPWIMEGGRRVVAITAIQGKKQKGSDGEQESFQQTAGTNWANFLVRRIEEQARQEGFDEIRLLRPEQNPWFQHRPEMNRLYYGVARKEGFKKSEDERWLVKKLAKEEARVRVSG